MVRVCVCEGWSGEGVCVLGGVVRVCVCEEEDALQCVSCVCACGSGFEGILSSSLAASSSVTSRKRSTRTPICRTCCLTSSSRRPS